MRKLYVFQQGWDQQGNLITKGCIDIMGPCPLRILQNCEGCQSYKTTLTPVNQLASSHRKPEEGSIRVWYNPPVLIPKTNPSAASKTIEEHVWYDASQVIDLTRGEVDLGKIIDNDKESKVRTYYC